MSVLMGTAIFLGSRYEDRWVRAQSRPGDGPATLIYSLDADAPVSGWLRNSTPTLRVSCADGVISLYVETRLPADVEPGSARTVRLQFDGEEPVVTNWEQSANHQALYPSSDDAVALGRRLAASRRFRFAFIPFRADVAIATFSLFGFDEHWRAIEAACGGGNDTTKDAARPRPSSD